jgi:hypothetical protein
LQFPEDANQVDSEKNLARPNCLDDGQTDNQHDDGQSKEHNNRRAIDDNTNYYNNNNHGYNNNSFADSFQLLRF